MIIIIISLLREGVCVCCCPCAAEWRRRPVVVDDCNGTADCVGRRDEDVSERPALGWFDWQWRRLGYQAPSAHRSGYEHHHPPKQGCKCRRRRYYVVLRSTRRLFPPSVWVRLTYALAVDCVFLLLRRRHWTKERRHEKSCAGRENRPAVPIRTYFSLSNVSHFYHQSHSFLYSPEPTNTIRHRHLFYF